jgi:hypothetical protein
VRDIRSETENLWHTALLLEYFTVAYNIAKAGLLIFFGMLAGLGANYLFGFWQADPLVGIIIVLFREGFEGWTEAGDVEEEE